LFRTTLDKLILKWPRPVLSLKNTELLVSWYEELVAAGDNLPPPPPPEAEIFKSENYANFIYLFFKIGTEVNVFAHLGKVLFTQMKESVPQNIKGIASRDSVTN
jgi:hypothetical protein